MQASAQRDAVTRRSWVLLAPRPALWYGSAYMLFVLFIWEDKKKERNPSGWEMEIGWGVKKAMNFRAGLYRGCRGY